MVHHSVTQHFGHLVDDDMRHVVVVSAVKHAKQRLIGVEAQLFQNTHTQPACHSQNNQQLFENLGSIKSCWANPGAAPGSESCQKTSRATTVHNDTVTLQELKELSTALPKYTQMTDFNAKFGNFSGAVPQTSILHSPDFLQLGNPWLSITPTWMSERVEFNVPLDT